MAYALGIEYGQTILAAWDDNTVTSKTVLRYRERRNEDFQYLRTIFGGIAPTMKTAYRNGIEDRLKSAPFRKFFFKLL
ncbi:MAG: hypothetical protein V4443_05020 [Pseudomonadota bacterium]